MQKGSGKKKNTNSSRLTVGVLLDSVDSYFNHRAIIDLIDAAEEQTIHLVFYLGGILEKNKAAGSLSFTYTLPDPEFLDALIVFPHSISPFSPQKAVQDIFDLFPLIPIYSFFGEIPLYYSIWVNETPALESMIKHLVEDHSYTKFALLCGPDSPESISHQRQTIISDALHKHGLTIDPSFIFSGSFSELDGKKTARNILKGDGDSPEVLICMNDQMAIGAVKEFQNTGISIPEDIAVVGFDDVEENSSLPCPFTTINFPIWEMISTVIERIVSDASGETKYSNDKIEYPAQFMHRESCGCTSFFEQKTKTEETFIPLEQPRSSHGILKRQALLRRSLEEVIEDCIITKETVTFTEFIQQEIENLSRSGNLTNSFIDTFSTQWTVTLLQHQDFDTQVFINALFVDAFRLLIQIKMKAFQRIHSNDLGSLSFYQSCNALLSQKISMVSALQGIGSNIPQLGINRCLIVFISQEKPDMGELRLSYKEGVFTDIPDGGFITFPIKTLVDTGINSIHTPLAILTIAHNNITYGYLVLSITDKHFAQFSMIQELISQIIDSAMTNNLLSTHIQTLTKNNKDLSRLSVIDEFTGLYNRRALYLTGRSMYQLSLDNEETSCFIFVDMDGLKIINDTFGHQEGDAAILALSNSLRKSFREKDLIVRYGGDEFVILMVNIQEAALQKALTRITIEIDTYNELKLHAWVLSASWGYVFNNDFTHAKSFDLIIEESDAKLYEVKRQKRALKQENATL